GFDETTHMFNAGVIGLGDQARRLLDEVAALTKDLVDLSPTPLHTLEQFAFRVVLGGHFTIRTSDDAVRHYTGWKRRFVHQRLKEIVPEFSRTAFDAALGDARQVDELPRTRKIDVARSKLKAWQRAGLNDYGFAHLCYQSAFSSRSRSDANAW